MNCLWSLSAFSGFGFDLFGYLILVESQNVCPFLVWFISLTIMTVRFIHIVVLSELPTLKGWIIFHCVSTTVCLWSWLPWTLRLLLFVGQCESCCCDYDCRSMHFFQPLFPYLFGTQHELESNYEFIPCVSFGIISVMSCTVAAPFNFFCMVEYCSSFWIYPVLHIQSLTYGHLNGFYLWAIVNNVTMNICVPVFDWIINKYIVLYMKETTRTYCRV